MSAVYDDIMSSLKELVEMSEGKETEAIVHKRTVREPELLAPEKTKPFAEDVGILISQ